VALERKIIKSDFVAATTFDHKPAEIDDTTSDIAKDYVAVDAFRTKSFKISELVARQTGILQMETDKQQDKVNSQVLDRLKEVQEKAYSEGYALGLKEGTEKAFQESQAVLLERLHNMEELLKRIETLKSRLLVDNEGALIRLVFLVASKIAIRDLSEGGDAVKGILASVVGEVQADETVVVKLSPEDLQFMEELQQKTGQKIESLERVKLVAQPEIARGGCLIETEFGTVNATVEERVERVWQALQSRIPQNRAMTGE
jgi:flagellar assembly protein FliH